MKVVEDIKLGLKVKITVILVLIVITVAVAFGCRLGQVLSEIG